jgi:hypothetical protein
MESVTANVLNLGALHVLLNSFRKFQILNELIASCRRGRRSTGRRRSYPSSSAGRRRTRRR